MGGLMSGWLISYHGSQQRSMAPPCPLMSYQVEMLCSKIRTLISWGGFKYLGRSVRLTECRCNRHCLSRCTGSKKATILGGLMIHIVVIAVVVYSLSRI